MQSYSKFVILYIIIFYIQIEELKSALKSLQPTGYIALHGMKGFGKSCLTASTLNDKDLTSQLFNVTYY